MDDDTIICECLKTTYGDIKEAIDSGCRTVACIEKKTGAGSACGQCKSLDDDLKFKRRYHIQEDILDEL
jgi:NAD(P)H-nitrite reductase large subunit